MRESPPEWAYRLPKRRRLRPSVPFVGKDYERSSPRIAVYASAENLAHYERAPKSLPPFMFDGRAGNRHRAALDDWLAAKPSGFWPKVHVGPVENGSLLCAALFVLERLGSESSVENPLNLLERLLVANVGKYSKLGEKNVDYIRSLKDLQPSLPYLRVDLRVGQPDLVLFPQGAARLGAVRQLLAEEIPSARVLPVPQFNATVVNVHLAQYGARAAELAEELAGTALSVWMKRLTGYRANHAYRYLAFLEQLLR